MNGRQRAVWGTLARATSTPETARGRKGRPAQGGSTTGQRGGRHSSICAECSRTPEPWAGREWGEATGVSREEEQAPPVCTHFPPRGPGAHRHPGCSQRRPQHPGCAPHVSSFITALKGAQTPKRRSLQPGQAVGGVQVPAGSETEGKGSAGSRSPWVGRGPSGSTGHVGTSYSGQSPPDFLGGTEFQGILRVFLLVEQAPRSPCAGLEAGLLPGISMRRPPALHWGLPVCPCWGRRSYFKGGHPAPRLDALGGSLSLWEARGANLPPPGHSAAAGKAPQAHSPARSRQLARQPLSPRPPAHAPTSKL